MKHVVVSIIYSTCSYFTRAHFAIRPTAVEYFYIPVAPSGA
jgi:hypothetical protein